MSARDAYPHSPARTTECPGNEPKGPEGEKEGRHEQLEVKSTTVCGRCPKESPPTARPELRKSRQATVP